MEYSNRMSLRFGSLSENEGFARLAVASFCSNKIKSLEVLSDIKTAVSEAVTNCIVHGYNSDTTKEIVINCELNDRELVVEIIDEGCGIEDIIEAQKPFFTTKPELERSGMGFTVMEGFMDKVDVVSEVGKGTKVILTKIYK